MRYAALHFSSATDISPYVIIKYALNDSHLKAIKGTGYELTKEVDGMLMMDGNESRGYNKFAIIPETHPAFNGGMFVVDDDRNIKANIKREVKEPLTNIVKRAFFTA